MGKQEHQTAAVPAEPSAAHRCCLGRSTWKCLVSVILGLYLLAFALWSLQSWWSRGHGSQVISLPTSMSHAEASFRLQRSVSFVNENLSQLQADLGNEIGIPNTQIGIVDIFSVSTKNCTEVRFTVSPDRSNDTIAPAELSLLKETLVELFMQQSANLSLNNNLFGAVTHFEVLHFPGGITVVPPQPGFPLYKVVVLFNFTLHDSLAHVNQNFVKFRNQLANGIRLKPHESLFVQLTNVEGSTVSSSLVVQTSILPVVGLMLPTLRLQQLAREVIASPRKNLGLNHTLFGRVKQVELSSYLEYGLDSTQTPSPSPSPAPSPSPSSVPSSSGLQPCAGHMPILRGHAKSQATHPSFSPTYMAPAPGYKQHNHRRQMSGGSPVPSPLPNLGWSEPRYEAPLLPPLISRPGSSAAPIGESPTPSDGLSAIPSAPVSISSTGGLAPKSLLPISSPTPTSSAILVGIPAWMLMSVLLAGVC